MPRKSNSREDWEKISTAHYLREISVLSKSKRKCKKCGSVELKGYPHAEPIVWICLDCGAWHDEESDLIE